MDTMISKALQGDNRSIAKVISLVEGESQFSDSIMRKIYPYSGTAQIVGVTGSPGAGKSTFSDKLIKKLKAQGKKIGVIAVDPTSPFSGGAILGDRLRMQQHALDPDIFIRSMGTRGSLGGLSRSTYEAALILDACQKDVVIIETVGVGQSEVDIVKIADTVCLMLVPGMGDDVQTMKAGIMEIADLFVINKADHDGADRLVTEVNIMLDLMGERQWRPPVLKTVSAKGTGIDEVYSSLNNHNDFLVRSEEGRRRRFARLELEVEEVLRREVARIVEQAWDTRKMEDPDILQRLAERQTDPYAVADSVLDRAL
ncbi:MAG: methylmalonyl Co-A mutase-associated GTPase MeaB [Synergistales bacterium]|nr:methylmalonyl Co-A mutase-associated GTPase MeaB [Synergistales bacterium]